MIHFFAERKAGEGDLMTEQPLQVQSAGLRRSAVDLSSWGDWMTELHGEQGSTPAMPLGALGIIGEGARQRYNQGFRGFNDRLIGGAHSARYLSQNLNRNADGYNSAENDNVAALFRIRLDDPRDLDHKLLGWRDWYYSGNTLFDRAGMDKTWQGVTLLTGVAVGGLSTYGLRQMMANGRYVKHADDNISRYTAPGSRPFSEKSRIAIRSGRTAGLLKVAGQMSLAATLGALLWATAVVPNDEILDDHVDHWEKMALSLGTLFYSGDPEFRTVLAQAWSGEAMEAADKKLRAFVTAGIQLSDEAVARAYDLAAAVAHLNLLHDLAFAVTLAGVTALAVIRTSYAVNPVAALALQETMGRKITMATVAVQGAITALMAVVLYADMDGQREESGPSNVPPQDFPQA